jgi:hypothetical protein
MYYYIYNYFLLRQLQILALIYYHLWNLRTGSLAFALPPRVSHRGKDYLQSECYAMFDADGCHLYYFAPNNPVLVSTDRFLGLF